MPSQAHHNTSRLSIGQNVYMHAIYVNATWTGMVMEFTTVSIIMILLSNMDWHSEISKPVFFLKTCHCNPVPLIWTVWYHPSLLVNGRLCIKTVTRSKVKSTVSWHHCFWNASKVSVPSSPSHHGKPLLPFHHLPHEIKQGWEHASMRFHRHTIQLYICCIVYTMLITTL